ncbi:MAG: VCBS repeat-containing protein, partial [Gemmatimonadota bacterium]
VSIGDLDGDGHLDLVLAKGRHWPLVSRVLLGDDHGGVRTAFDLSPVAYRSYSARLVDLDGDGDLDIVLSNDRPDPKLVYLNDGTGHFQSGSTYGRPEWQTRNAAVADVNHDGRPDIIVANRADSATSYICLNRGAGQFDADCDGFSHYSATTITAADFNRDGWIDLAVPHRDGGQSYVYLSSEGAFSEARRVPFGPPDATIRMAEVADFNGDSIPDIVSIDERRGVAVYSGRRDGSFGPGVSVGDVGVAPYALGVGDLDLDGRIDIVVGNVEAPSTILFNDGPGRAFIPVHFGDSKGTVYGFAIADVDRDGLPDIAVARSESPNVIYFATPGH